nr:hypothetical protein [Tanacetum cinerariifolium]
MDDLYNNLKVYEAEIKSHSSSDSNSYIVAFVSFENTRSINETVNAAHDIPTAGLREQPSTSSYTNDIDTDDLEEMDLKWQVAMITMRGNRSADNKRRVVLVETLTSALVVQDGFASDSSVSEIEEDNNQAKDRYKVGIWYHAVPPPYTGNYMPPRADLSFTGLDDSVFKYKISKPRTSVNENESIASKSSKEIREEHKAVRKFVPTAVAAKSGQVLINVAKQNAAASTSTARPKVKTAAIRPNGKNVTTAGPKALVNAVEGKNENVVKCLACWIWRPKGKLVDHTSKDSGSYTLKRFNYVAPNGRPKPVNDKEQIHALVDKMKVIITEDSIRSDLRFDDAEGTACLLNEEIFEGLAHMGIRAGFFWVTTPLFNTMMVQAPADMGDTPVEIHQTPIVDQPLTFKPHKKQQPRRKQRKEAEVSNDESEDEDHVSTPSSGPLPSGEDSFILNELMVFCICLQEHLLDLQEAKVAQEKEIAALKKKFSKLSKWRKSRSGGLRRLKKIGSCRRVKSLMKKDGLGAQENATKQGRMTEEIDQNAEIALDDETQVRINDDEMFGGDDLAGEEVVIETTTGVKDSFAPTTDVTEDEVTMAQALAALKSTKPKVVVQEQETSTTIPAAATIVTTTVPTPRANGIVFHEQKQSQIPIVSSSKDKGKAKMIEPEVPIKRKEQMRIDEEYARKLEAKEQETARLSKAQQDEEANKYWDNMQAVMDVDRLLAENLQVDKNIEPAIDDFEELRKCIEIVPDDGDEVLSKATPISSRSPPIIDYKIHKEGKKTYFKINRADGNSRVYQTFEKMFKNFNKDDLEVSWDIVKDGFKKEKPVDDMDTILFRTLKTMFEHHVEDTIWNTNKD